MYETRLAFENLENNKDDDEENKREIPVTLEN